MHGQIQPSQIQRTIARTRSVQVKREIQNFLEALDSYPARVAREPRLSFRQHLCSVFASGRDPRADRS
jgi:hypothetical protein